MNLKYSKLFLVFLLIVIITLVTYFYVIKHKVQVPKQTNVDLNEPGLSIPIQSDNSIASSTVVSTSSGTDKYGESMLVGMKLTFDDEFNTLNLYIGQNNNDTCEPGGKGTWQTIMYFCSRTIYTNNEAEIYTDQNFLDYYNKKSTTKLTSVSPFSINNGILTIEATPADPVITQAAGSWAKYTSGLLTTQFSFSQTYGYFEMRAKLPKGNGLWPAFWLLPIDKSWPPEIDALEAFGGISSTGEGKPTTIHYASHTNDITQSCGAWHDVGVDVTDDFHTYGVDWEPTGITYYFDGKPYVTCKPNPQANKPFYILINLAVGGPGSWPGTPDASNVWPAQMQVDYVRAYQKIK